MTFVMTYKEEPMPSRGLRSFCVYATALCVVLSGGVLRAEDEAPAEKINGPAIDAASLSIEKAIDLVLRNNLTLKSARYDVIMSDTNALKFDKKFATTLNLEGGYAYQHIPKSSTTRFSGTRQEQSDIGASISKLFSSGTTLTAGVKEVFFDTNDQGFSGFTTPDPAYHKPALFVSIQQELLRNAFGWSDRKQKEILNNATTMQRLAIVNILSSLVVGALVDYWNVTVQRSAMENARLELESDRTVRNIIARNVQYGLAEGYTLNQFNMLVAAAETKLENATQRHRDAVRKLLRTLNMPPETQIKGVTELTDTLSVSDADEGVRAAYAKRVDYRNAQMQLENARLDLRIQRNFAMPSVTLGASLSTLGQDESFPPAFREASSYMYPSYQVRLKLSYPLDDTELKANVRNAEFRLKQAEIGLESLKLEVRDDVLTRYDGVKLQHSILMKARTARSESELYYQKALARFRQGRVGALEIKTALDAMVQTRQAALEALVYYNVALLQYDLAKNEIFERYNVDVEKYIRDIKE